MSWYYIMVLEGIMPIMTHADDEDAADDGDADAWW